MPELTRPAQVVGAVVSLHRAGAYHRIVVTAPGVAGGVRPGHFVALAVGGPDTSMLLRRAFSVHRTDERDGGSVELVFAVHGRGTQWLAERRAGDPVDIVGPLGRPFALPKERASCVLVGGGYGSAPLFALAAALRARKCQVHMVLGAATEDRLFGVAEAKGLCDTLAVTTDDGSRGRRGMVSDVLPAVIAAAGAEVVYACGPMGMLAAVSRIAAECGAYSQCAVEESMACGIGVCMTCVLPVTGDDGVTRMVRSCVEGPVFRGEQVRWADVGTVPSDAVGAPAAAGAHR